MKRWIHQLDIIQDTSVDAVFCQEIYCFRESELQCFLFPLELLSGKLRSDGIYLFLVSLLQVLKQVLEKAVQQLEHFVVVLLYSHFQIQSNKLRQVTMGIGIFRTENWSNLIHALKVCRDGHLLVELWRLCQISIALGQRSH